MPQITAQITAQIVGKVVDEPDERVENGGRIVWGRASLGTNNRAGVVKDDAKALGTADIDADARGHESSERTFSSRTVFRMRTSARRLTKPGNGTTSSITRSYRTSVPPLATAVKW